MARIRWDNTKVELDEAQRQMTLLALAKLSIERPGWLFALREIALLMDDADAGGFPEMFQELRNIHCVPEPEMRKP